MFSAAFPPRFTSKDNSAEELAFSRSATRFIELKSDVDCEQKYLLSSDEEVTKMGEILHKDFENFIIPKVLLI